MYNLTLNTSENSQFNEFDSLPSLVLEVEATVYKIETEFNEGSSLPEMERANYLRKIRYMKEGILGKIKSMSGMPVKVIRAEVEASLKELDLTAQKFRENCQRCKNLDAAVGEQLKVIAVKAQTASQLQFDDFTPPPNNTRSFQYIMQQTAKQSTKEDLKEALLLLRAGAAVVEGVGKVVSVAARKVCEINSSTQSICKKITDVSYEAGNDLKVGAKKAIRTIGIEKQVKETYNFLYSTTENSSSAILEKEFHIPRAEIVQGVSDSTTLAACLTGNVLNSLGRTIAYSPAGSVVKELSRSIHVHPTGKNESNDNPNFTKKEGLTSSLISGVFLTSISGKLTTKMPKTMSGREMIKIYEEIDYKVVPKRGKGDHLVMSRPNSPTVTIPDHKQLDKGLQHALWKTREMVRQTLQFCDVINQPGSKAKIQCVKLPLSHRLDYTKKYFEAAQHFIDTPKEFNGFLSRDLVVLSYNNGAPLGSGRKFAWAMVPAEANKLLTVEAVKDYYALLSKFQDYTHVSLARIPAGEPVRFLYGRAVGQIDALANEIRPGGGVQYRFFDFDPKWVVKTREIPQ